MYCEDTLNLGDIFKNLGVFSKILGVSTGILEDSWRILREDRTEYYQRNYLL